MHICRHICVCIFICIHRRLCYHYYHRHKYTNISCWLRIRAFQNLWNPNLASIKNVVPCSIHIQSLYIRFLRNKNIFVSKRTSPCIYKYIYIYIYGEKNFRPDWKVTWTRYEIFGFFYASFGVHRFWNARIRSKINIFVYLCLR